MFKLHPKDSMTFRILDTNPAKGTVTLMPTFGTMMKFAIAGGGIIYASVLAAKTIIEDREPAVPKMDPDNETSLEK